MKTTEIVDKVEQYYTSKLRIHGATPAGVDWNSESSQNLRFEKLLQVVGDADAFSILDYGCGYGALLGYLRAGHSNFEYCGFDISAQMIAEAQASHSEERTKFTSDSAALEPHDFAVASGIFNVRLDIERDKWSAYVEQTIERLNELSKRGFAFNVLTSYSDPERMRSDLYYADPLALFDRCKRRYSRFVALLHDYPLYEFTIIVRK